jgi:hypothetical protein
MRCWVERWALAAAVLLVLPGTAFAQDAGISGQLERVANASSSEKVSYANAAVAEMNSAVKGVTKLVDAARRDADLDRVQCLNNRLVSLNSLLQVSETAQSEMEAQIAEGDEAGANSSVRQLAVALTKTRQLQAEAEGCGFDGTVQSGETAVTVEGGEFEEENDTDGVDLGFEAGLDGPEASPFM